MIGNVALIWWGFGFWGKPRAEGMAYQFMRDYRMYPCRLYFAPIEDEV